MSGLNPGGKREWLAHGLLWSGALLLLSKFPAKDMLLVLNYHRIGNPDDDRFGSGVFSATAEQFNNQICYLKRHVALVTLEEALAFVEGTSKEKTCCCRVLITFDDGYLDNYDIAYPILRSNGVQGVFFLTTNLVGSCHIPWWDQIAYLMKTARRRQFFLRYPVGLTVDIDTSGLTDSLRSVLSLYKKPENSDPARFMQELLEETGGDDPPGVLRRFLDWDEAREMIRGGMAIGSHTHSHHILSQLEPELQLKELVQSRSIFKEQLGFQPDALAYPVGGRTSFTDQTQRAARDAGYRAAFSFYGGTNLRGSTSPFDVNRVGVGRESWDRFRVRTAVCRFTGKYWP